MFEQSWDALVIWLVWIHAAILLVPALVLMGELEWKDLHEDHPHAIAG